MPQLEWNEGLSVGVEAIDNDHKILLDLINKISFAIEKNEETSAIEEVFGQLEAYVVEHFSREEQLMRDCHYPGLREHIKLHRKLTSKVPELKAELLAADSREAAEEINLFLFDWLMNHILGDDMLFAQQAYDEGFADVSQQQQRENTSIRKVTSWLGSTLTLRQRIILTAVIPITSIALLCMTVFWMSFQRFSDIEQLLNVTQITEEVNELSHKLQTERGLSTAVISSNYSQLEYQLKNQRKETDQAYDAFTNALNQLTSQNIDHVISMQISATQAQLQQLNHQRTQIDQQVSSPQQVLSFYADLVNKLFRIPEDNIQLQVDPELSRLLTAYSAVLHMKEASGLQRALGIRAIIKDQFSPEEYEHYASLIGEQRSFLKIFKQFTSEQQRHILLPFFEGDAIQSARKMEHKLFIAIQEKQLKNLDSQQWFQVMTDKISQLKILADQLSADIELLAIEKLRQQKQNLYLTTVLLVGILLLATLLSWLLNRSIISPMIRITQAMSYLARGDRGIRFVDHFANDELGKMVNAYEQCRRSLLRTDITSMVNTRRQGVELQSRIQEKERYQKLASTDPLTGAVNRRKFNEQAQTEIDRLERHYHPMSLLMLDLDHFKNVNDTFGHAAGDEVLKAFCQVCYDNARKTDIVARLGGEEFAILLPDASLRQAHQLAERVCQATRELEIRLPDIEQAIKVTVSIGISAWNIEKFNSIDDMLEIADQALYKAKHTGRDQVCGISKL